MSYRKVKKYLSEKETYEMACGWRIYFCLTGSIVPAIIGGLLVGAVIYWFTN